MPVALFIRQSPSLRIEATTPEKKKKTYIKSSAALSNKPYFIFFFLKHLENPTSRLPGVNHQLFRLSRQV